MKSRIAIVSLNEVEQHHPQLVQDVADIFSDALGDAALQIYYDTDHLVVIYKINSEANQDRVFEAAHASAFQQHPLIVESYSRTKVGDLKARFDIMRLIIDSYSEMIGVARENQSNLSL